MIVNKLEDLVGKAPVLATIAYVHVQDWGIFAHADSNTFETRERAEQWLAEQSQARAIYWSEIRQLPVITSVETIREQSIVSLQTEKDHMRQKMAEELAKIDDRIENLRALPAPSARNPKLVEREEFVVGFLFYLESRMDFDDQNPFDYEDEEGNRQLCASLEDLRSLLWQCDFEKVHLLFGAAGVVTLYLVWDNAPPCTIADFSSCNTALMDEITAHCEEYCKSKGYE